MMNETIRKRMVFASLVLAIIYGGLNLLPFKEKKTSPSGLSTVAALKADQVKPLASSLINVDSMAVLNWGRDPFQVIPQKTPGKTTGRKSGLGWHLSGILFSGNSPIAIINKKIVRTGDTVDKAKVIRIDRKQVILEYKGRKQTLTVSRG